GEAPVGAAAHETLDAYGKILSPGFLDIQGSGGLSLLVADSALPSLYQGVTTVITGAAGATAAPVGPEARAAMEKRLADLGGSLAWDGLGQWLDCLATLKRPVNIGTLVGHATVREGLCADPQQVSGVEIAAMGVVVDQALTEGAFGLATVLDEGSSSFASAEEVIELARPAASRGRLLVLRPRDDRAELEAALDEAVSITRAARLPVLISRLQAAEKPNWGRLTDAIFRLEDARAQSLDLRFAVCPYPTVAAALRTCLPKPALVGGAEGLRARLAAPEWQKYCADWLAYRGTDYDDLRLLGDGPGALRGPISEIARQRGVTPAQLVLQLVHADPDVRAFETRLSGDDVDAAVLSHESMISSGCWQSPIDLARPRATPHPAAAGTYARLVERFGVGGLVSFGAVIAKITSMPADLLGLTERGRIQEGAYADLVLFDPASVKDTATIDSPRSLATGVDRVWVNGRLTLADGEVRAPDSGKILRPSG
ncbi:MAG: amidohydrolase family protein, partial [Holophagales bacterium]|nr:amidohydrolase family protein [Holophagales bacterium]